MGRRNPPLFYKTKKMAIRFSNGFGIGASNNGGGGGGGPVVNCSPSSTLGGNLYYSSGTTLTWTDDTSGYTQYIGGYTNPDDGYALQAITMPSNFFMNCTGSTKLYISTNGFVTVEVGTANWNGNGPQSVSVPSIYGNTGDMYINTGASLSDGTTGGAWYKITNDGNYMKIELKIFQSFFQAQTTAAPYQLNLYKDSTHQWVETFVKDRTYPVNSGPTSSSDVSQPPSTTSKVWRGDLSGQNWEYMGEGSVTTILSTPISGGTINNGVTATSSYSFFGPGHTSYVFDGTSGYISLTGNTDTAMGTGDFTVEWFQFMNSVSGAPRVFSIGNYPSTSFGVSIENGTFYVWENGSYRFSANSAVLIQNWYHFAITRIAGTTTVYKNGISLGSYSDSNNLSDASTNLTIGSETSPSGTFFNGAISNFRWTKGLGIYTGNFTVPTSILTDTASANPYGGSNTVAIPSGYVKYLIIPS